MKRNPLPHLRDYGAAGRESMNKTRALQAMAYRFGVILIMPASDWPHRTWRVACEKGEKMATRRERDLLG
jgi:hypothetical protein